MEPLIRVYHFPPRLLAAIYDTNLHACLCLVCSEPEQLGPLPAECDGRDDAADAVPAVSSTVSSDRAGAALRPWDDVENIDLSYLVGGHQNYVNRLEEILSFIGLEDGKFYAQQHANVRPAARTCSSSTGSVTADTVTEP